MLSLPFWNKQEDLEYWSAMEWYNLVAKALIDIRSDQKTSRFKVKINQSQCSQVAMAFSAKLSKFWPHELPSPPFLSEDSDGGSSGGSRRNRRGNKIDSFYLVDNQSESCRVLESCKHALREVYRVVKDLEAFLLLCSAQEWWKSSLLRADNGEVLSVHVHDLVWSVAALDVTIHHAKRCSLEVIDAVCSRRLTECYAEMSSLRHQMSETADRKQLISLLEGSPDQPERPNRGKKRVLRPGKTAKTLRVEEDRKQRISAHFLCRLQNHSNSNLAAFQLGLPETLSIDHRDLDFSERRYIGRGSFGHVYEASWLGMKVAVKELPCGDSQLFKEEASILAKLRSPFIVQLIGWSVHEEANLCHLVMELCSSDLQCHIGKRSSAGPPFSLRVAVDIMLQIARGMEYLHSQRVIHRDLRASNILVDSSSVTDFLGEGHVRVKLCDFGMAKAKRNSSNWLSSMKGSTYWRAPEVFSDPDFLESEETPKKPYTNKVDVYSFAMTCYEILTGKIPFEGTLRKEVQSTIMNGGRPELPSSCPSLLSNYIRRCWHGDDKCRPSFTDVCRVLRHVKLLLLRLDDVEDVSFQSVKTEYDYVELLNSTGKLSLSFNGGRDSFISRGSEASGDDEELRPDSPVDPASSSRPSRSSFQRIRSVLSFSSKPMEMEPRESSLLSSLPCFITKYTLHDLRTATANFSERVSNGEAGSVYRGVLCDDSVIAVKAVKFAFDIRLFCIKVVALGNAYHPNLVRFRGYCAESPSHFLFVFDYMDNLSLDRWLALSGESGSSEESSSESNTLQSQETDSFTWAMRLKIALGVARGLAFLHEDCGQCILPVGLKPSKILLDKDCEPRLNSLSLVESENNQYYSHKVFSDKPSTKFLVMSPAVVNALRSDVYRFGIILFDLAVGRAVDFPETLVQEGLASFMNQPKKLFELIGEQQSFSTVVEEKSALGLLDLVLARQHDSSFAAEGNSQAVEKARLLLQTAMWCVQGSEVRPTMSQVVSMLEGTLTIPQEFWSSFNALL